MITWRAMAASAMFYQDFTLDHSDVTLSAHQPRPLIGHMCHTPASDWLTLTGSRPSWGLL